MRVAIACEHFFLPELNRPCPGGATTYLTNLTEVLQEAGHQVTVFQHHTPPFVADWNGIPIRSYASAAEQHARITSLRPGLTVYLELYTVPPRPIRPAIAIQHGVYWDVHNRTFASPLLQRLLEAAKVVRSAARWRRLSARIRSLDRVVTVDTNFQNLLRVQDYSNNFSEKWVYVPNCAVPCAPDRVTAKLAQTGPVHRVVFARRFEMKRGVLLWADVVCRLASEFPNVAFPFCGHDHISAGTEAALRSRLSGLPNAVVYEREYPQMAEEHFQADIEIVPSLGSEGTSLSLIEAMANGACPVATIVGGLTDIVIPEFNGVLVQPSRDLIYGAVRDLISDPDRVRRLAANAYATACAAFSRDLWGRRILQVVSDVTGTPAQGGSSFVDKQRSGDAAPQLPGPLRAGEASSCEPLE